MSEQRLSDEQRQLLMTLLYHRFGMGEMEKRQPDPLVLSLISALSGVDTEVWVRKP